MFFRDSIILSILSCLTSIFCGFVIFPYIGYLAEKTGQKIENVIQSSSGLAFVVFPYAVSTLKVSPLWSILFFSMVLIIGIDNMMASTETTITALKDLIPYLKKNELTSVLTSASVCLIYFLIGLLCCTRAGTYWVEFFNNFTGS
jgi:SNF family Na+-dependent transporter